MAERTSDQLRREAEQSRAQLTQTLEELRARITPGQVVDQLADYAGDRGAGEFFRNLGRQALNNPLPVTLMGAGLAWLMLAGDSSTKRTSASLSETTRRTADDCAGTAKRASDEAASGLHETRDKAASAYEDASMAAARTATASHDQSQAMAQSAANASRSLLDFCKEQPLLLVGLGLALGAALGAAMPATRTENELMGEASDRLKERAQSLAAEQYDKAAAVAEHAYEQTMDAAEHVYEEAKEEAERQNLAGPAEIAESTQQSVPTAPSLPEEASEGTTAPRPRHGRRR